MHWWFPDQARPSVGDIKKKTLESWCACSIWGVVSVGTKLACEPLATLQLLFLQPHQPEQMEQLARICKALTNCIRELLAGYKAGTLQQVPATFFPSQLFRSLAA